MESTSIELETTGMITPNQKDKNVLSARREEQENINYYTQENNNVTDITIKT